MKISAQLQATMKSLEKQADLATKVASELKPEPEKMDFGSRRVRAAEGSRGQNIDTEA